MHLYPHPQVCGGRNFALARPYLIERDILSAKKSLELCTSTTSMFAQEIKTITSPYIGERW